MDNHPVDVATRIFETEFQMISQSEVNNCCILIIIIYSDIQIKYKEELYI